jgi:hypothetical protein
MNATEWLKECKKLGAERALAEHEPVLRDAGLGAFFEVRTDALEMALEIATALMLATVPAAKPAKPEKPEKPEKAYTMAICSRSGDLQVAFCDQWQEAERWLAARLTPERGTWGEIRPLRGAPRRLSYVEVQGACRGVVHTPAYKNNRSKEGFAQHCRASPTRVTFSKG